MQGEITKITDKSVSNRRFEFELRMPACFRLNGGGLILDKYPNKSSLFTLSSSVLPSKRPQSAVSSRLSAQPLAKVQSPESKV